MAVRGAPSPSRIEGGAQGCRPVNPFATRCVGPAAVPYLFAEGGENPAAIARRLLAPDRPAAAVVGPHGTGKTTLLHHLRPHLERAAPIAAWHRLTSGASSLGVVGDALTSRRGSLLVVDGFEQIPRLLRHQTVATARLRRVGLLVTSHRPVPGLATAVRTTGGLATTARLLDHLLADHARYRPVLQRRLRARWGEFGGNTREALFAMYDEYEAIRRRSPAAEEFSMPARLPVVLAQSATAGPERDLEESLVTELMMQHGADVSLVRPLAQLDAGQTDQLMLEGIAGDFVLLAWQRPEASLAALAALGIGGKLGATPWTPAAADRGRRIYAIDLRPHEDTREIGRVVAGLLRDRQTPTFSLGGAAAGSRGPTATGRAAPPSAPSAPSAPPPSAAPAAGVGSAEAVERALSDDALEGLVDRLDALDL